jgi:hypothetical protein
MWKKLGKRQLKKGLTELAPSQFKTKLKGKKNSS